MSDGLSCPTVCGILVPWPGIEPTSPPMGGKFLTIGPPGKSHHPLFKNISDHPSFPSSSQPWCMLELPREVLNLWCPGPTPGQTPEAEGLALVLWTFNHSCFDLYFCFCLSLDMCVRVCVCVCVCVYSFTIICRSNEEFSCRNDAPLSFHLCFLKKNEDILLHQYSIIDSSS